MGQRQMISIAVAQKQEEDFSQNAERRKRGGVSGLSGSDKDGGVSL